MMPPVPEATLAVAAICAVALAPVTAWRWRR
jgi:hypothetical protein